MEIPRLGVQSELQLPAYTTATATPDPSHVCDLHHCSQQCRILNPLSKARNWICILIDTSQICFHWAMTGTPRVSFNKKSKLPIFQGWGITFYTHDRLTKLKDTGLNFLISLFFQVSFFFLSFFFFFLSFVFCLFRAALTAHGGSQVRSWIRTTVAGLCHSNARFLDPLSKARDRTHILMDTSLIRFLCATTGTPKFAYFFFFWSFRGPHLWHMEVPRLEV